MPEQVEWLIMLFSMIQPLLQCVPIKPICSAVGGAHGVAASRMREAADGDVVHARLLRIEHRAAHVDLDELLVRVDARELRPDRGVVLVHPAKPERRGGRGLQDVIQRGRFDQPLAVQIDGAGVMLAALGIKPVAVDQVAVGIEAAEE